jgi:tetratricopeptide (TPR) repeat protein
MNNLRIWLSLLFVFSVGCALVVHGQSRSRSKRAPAGQKTATLPGTAPDTAFENAVKVADEARVAGRLDEAIEAYTKAVSIRPKWPDGWWYLGAIYYARDLYPQARDAFSNLVALQPERGPAWGMLGLCQFRTSEYERSIASLERSYILGLDDNKELKSVVLYHSALLYVRFEQFEMAYQALRQLENYDNQKIIEAFGLIMLRMPVLPNQIPGDKREQVLLAGRAGASMAARHLDASRKFFGELVANYPDDPNVHYSYGVFILPQDAETALKEFQRAHELDPNHQPAMVQMAFEYLKRRDYDAALPLAEKSVALAPRMFPARNVLGRVLLELGQIERAIHELEEGVRLAPASPDMHFALARAYTRAGRKADADRENEIFKKLEEKYNQQAETKQTDGVKGTATPKPSPENQK